MKKYMVTLTRDEREVLGNLESKGKHRSQKMAISEILNSKSSIESVE